MPETVQQKSGSINDILKIVNRANETFVYEIFVPSLAKNVMFREINTAQQKRLLKAVIDSPVYNTEFIFTLREIIKENCVDSLIDIDALTLLDKLVIALMLRSISISNELDLEFKIPKSDQKIVRRINVKDLADKAKEIKIEPTVIKDDTGTFEIFCGLPTISDEFNLENQLRHNVESIEIKNEKELRNTIGEVFTNEIVKYIKQVNIKIKDKDEVYEFNLKDMAFKDRLTLMGKIPTKINNKVIEYINSIKGKFETILLFKEEIEGQIVEQRLKIDASFFTPS
jgi:hypothetical protein